MRAAPAFQVSLRRFDMWRWSVLLVWTIGVAVMVAWLVERESMFLSPSSVFAGLGLLASIALGVPLLRPMAVDLRWDGRAWHLGPATGEPIAGDLHIALDLGSWMLLRFFPASWTSPLSRNRAIWLPLQRRGLEPQWHALRCAVYSPRAAPPDDTPVSF